MTPRLYIDAPLAAGITVPLNQTQVHYLKNVLRKEEGDDVLVFNGYSADGVADGIEGCESALSGQYDLVLLDVMLPGMDGFSICREIRRQRPVQPVIILTAKGSEDDVVAGFTAGDGESS